jgi:hypothetical protein
VVAEDSSVAVTEDRLSNLRGYCISERYGIIGLNAQIQKQAEKRYVLA